MERKAGVVCQEPPGFDSMNPHLHRDPTAGTASTQSAGRRTEPADLSLVERLLDEYEAQRQQGRRPDIDQLCCEYPHLRAAVQRQIEALERFETTFRPGPDVALPRDVGRFRQESLIGNGGIGDVYRAWDQELNRYVALKCPRAADSRPTCQRFQREAQLTAALDHPGVIPVYGSLSDDEGRPFYAMRLIDVEDLESAIARFHAQFAAKRAAPGKSSALRALLRSFVSVCQTMAFAHSKGVIHRDLKPRNILIGEYGETLVADWGLARVCGEPTSSEAPWSTHLQGLCEVTTEGTISGSPAFMSPEQARGEVSRLGPATDVFGLGTTLYKILTGRNPFEPGPDQLERICEAQFPLPRNVRPDVPRPPTCRGIILVELAMANGLAKRLSCSGLVFGFFYASTHRCRSRRQRVLARKKPKTKPEHDRDRETSALHFVETPPRTRREFELLPRRPAPGRAA